MRRPQVYRARTPTGPTRSLRDEHERGVAPAMMPVARVSRGWDAVPVLALMWLVAMLSIGLDRPWTGSLDYDGAIWSQAAHNNLRAGLARTRGVSSSWHFGPLPIPPQGYYVDHPPGLPLLVTVSFAAFGEKEWAARLVPIAHTLLGAILLWLLVRCAAGRRVAALTILMLAVLPMEMYVGRMLHFETCAAAWILVAFVALALGEATGRSRWAVTALGAFFVAMCFSWYAYVLGAVLAALLVLDRSADRRRFGAALVVLAAVAFALFLFHIRLVRPDAWSEIAQALRFRSGGEIEHGGGLPITWGSWLAKQIAVQRSLVGLGPWLLAGVGVVHWARLRARAGRRDRHWAELATLAFAIATCLYLVGFRNGSYIHSFWGFDCVFPIAVAAGYGLEAAFADAERRGRTAGAVAGIVVAAAAAALAWRGRAEVVSLHSYVYRILEGGSGESANLIPTLGAVLEQVFDDRTTLLSNLPHRGPQLRYYAQRSIHYDLKAPAGWREQLDHRGNHPGGLIWMEAPGAEELLAGLPAGRQQPVRIGGVRFTLWKPGSRIAPR